MFSGCVWSRSALTKRLNHVFRLVGAQHCCARPPGRPHPATQKSSSPNPKPAFLRDSISSKCSSPNRTSPHCWLGIPPTSHPDLVEPCVHESTKGTPT